MSFKDHASHTRDLTQGNPIRLIMAFAVPILIGGVFQQLYSVVDTLIVGNAVGSKALAAIGATGSVIFFMVAFAIGIANAFTVVMSQHFGAQNEEMVKRTLVSSIYITIGITVFISLIGIFGARPLLELMRTPEDIIDDAVLYIQVCMGGGVGVVIYNAAASVLRAVGDSKTPLKYLIVATLLNIFLDLVFVLVFKLDVLGVAVATVISQIVSGVLCIRFMMKNYPIFWFTKKEMPPDWINIGIILKIGLLLGLQMLFISVGEMFTAMAVNKFGTNAVAAYTTSLRVQEFATLIYLNFSTAFEVFAGQNMGAMKLDRIKKGFKQTAGLILVFSSVSAILVFVFGDVLVGWFISSADLNFEAILGLSRTNLRIQSFFYPVLAMIWLYNNALRGMGDVMTPLFSGVLEIFSKVGGSFLYARFFGLTGVWFVGPMSWLFGMLPSMVNYHNGSWKKLAGKVTGDSSL